MFSYNAKSVPVRLFCRDSTCWAFCFACSTFQTCICIDFVFSITFVDSFSWTCFCTCSAVNANIWVDYVFVFSLRDSFRWALAFTSSARYTFVCNYVCHWFVLLIERSLIRQIRPLPTGRTAPAGPRRARRPGRGWRPPPGRWAGPPRTLRPAAAWPGRWRPLRPACRRLRP